MVVNLMSETLYLIIKVSAPMLLVSLVVGLVISIFLVLMIAGNWILTSIVEYMEYLFDNFNAFIR